MKKRILAMLLSASLALSCFTVCAVADTTEATASPTDPLANAKWTGAAAISDSLPSDVSDEYVHLYGKSDYDEYFYYSDPSVTLKSGTKYRLSFYIRTMPSIGFPEQTQALFYNSKDILAAPGAVLVDADVKSTSRSNRMVLSTEWKKVSTVFEGDGNKLIIFFKSGDPDGVPNGMLSFDVRDLKLYEVDGVYCDIGSNLTVNDASKWHFARVQNLTNGAADKYTESDFVSVSSDGTNTTAKLSGITLEPGKYELFADFRLNTYDFSKATNLSSSWRTKLDHSKYTAPVTVTGGNGITVSANSVSVSTEWKKGSFMLDVTEAITAGELTFSLGNSIGFDIANVEIKSLSSYTTDYATDSGNPIAKTEFDRDYIQINGITYCDNGSVYYTDNSKTFENGKTYTITFDARTVSAANFPNGARMIRLNCNGEWGGSAGFVYITDSWETYTLTYTATANSAFRIKFCGSTLYWDVLPAEIDNLSIVEVSSGSEMVEHDDVISSTNGWSGSTGAKATLINGCDYYTAEAASALNIASEELLPSGVYKLTANFRLSGEFDRNKLTFNSSYYVTSDTNKTTVSAYNGDTLLKTTNGEASLPVDYTWNTAEFLLVVPVGKTVRTSDISFKFAEATDFDFTDITFAGTNGIYSDEYETVKEIDVTRVTSYATNCYLWEVEAYAVNEYSYCAANGHDWKWV